MTIEQCPCCGSDKFKLTFNTMFGELYCRSCQEFIYRFISADEVSQYMVNTQYKLYKNNKNK